MKYVMNCIKHLIILISVGNLHPMDAPDSAAESLPLEELFAPLVEKTVGTVAKTIRKKIKEREEKKQLKVAQEHQTALKKIFLGELEHRIIQLEIQLPTILQSKDAVDRLQEQLITMRAPLLPLLAIPEFTLARGLTPIIFHNLFMYTKQLQQSFADEFEQMIVQVPLPLFERFQQKIDQFKGRIAATASQIIAALIAPVDAKKEGVYAPQAIKIIRKPLKPKTTFDELVESSIIALKPLTGNKYLVQEGEKIKASSLYPYRDELAQFTIERYGQAIGLRGKLGYIAIQATKNEVSYAEQKFTPATFWVFEGDELGSIILKHKNTGQMLMIDSDDTLVTTQQIGLATRFACSILSKPWNTAALDYPLLTQLPAGTKIACKVKEQLSGAQSRYLTVDEQGFIKIIETSSSDWRCQFDVMRFGNYIGFKQLGWKNICIDPVSWTVYVAQRSSMMYSATEQWVIDPQNAESLKSVRLINRFTGGYMQAPTDWSKGRITTAGLRQPNPIRTFSSLATLPDYIYEAASQDNALIFDIEIIKPAPIDVEPGKQSLSFVPAIHGKNTVLFNKQWKSSIPGLVTTILSDIQAPASVFIALSDKPAVTKNTVYLLFGDQKNTMSGIRVFGSMAVALTKQQNPDVIITNPANESLWVTLKNNVVSFGKGPVPGKRQIASVQLEASLAQNLAYFGVGGGGNRVTFGSISWEKE